MMGNKGICLLPRNRNILCLCYSWRNQVIYVQSSPITYSNRAEMSLLFFLAFSGGVLVRHPYLASTQPTVPILLMHCLKTVQIRNLYYLRVETIDFLQELALGSFSVSGSQWSPL